MAALFGGYRLQVYHEVAQRLAVALKAKVAEDSHAVLVKAPKDSKVTKALKEIPGLLELSISENHDHEYLRQVTVKRPKRNAVRFLVLRQSHESGHCYVIRACKGLK